MSGWRWKEKKEISFGLAFWLQAGKILHNFTVEVSS